MINNSKCPQCQHQILLVEGYDLVYCESCSTQLQYIDNQLCLKKINQKGQRSLKSLAIGDVCHKDRKKFQVIAWVDYQVLSRADYTRWTEYHLYADDGEILYLGDSEEGWFIKEIEEQLCETKKATTQLMFSSTNKLQHDANILLHYEYTKDTKYLDEYNDISKRYMTINTSPAHHIVDLAGAFNSPHFIGETIEAKIYHIDSRFQTAQARINFDVLRVYKNNQWIWLWKEFISSSDVALWFKKTIGNKAGANFGGNKTPIFKAYAMGYGVIVCMSWIPIILGYKHKIGMASMVTIINLIAIKIVWLLKESYIEHKKYSKLMLFIFMHVVGLELIFYVNM